MTIFDGKRLTNDSFKLDVDRMRRGWYSDKYFENINRMLTALSGEGYFYSGSHHNLPEGMSPEQIAVGDNAQVRIQRAVIAVFAVLHHDSKVAAKPCHPA